MLVTNLFLLSPYTFPTTASHTFSKIAILYEPTLHPSFTHRSNHAHLRPGHMATITQDTATTIVKALELGYTMIDTSSDYGTQPGIGQGLAQSRIIRDDSYLVTKIEETDEALERTQSNLKDLDLDFVDLTLIHRPPPSGPGIDLWQGLIQAQADGLTRDIGVSNYSTDQIDNLIQATGVTPVVNQIEWSPFGHSQTMKDYCHHHQIIIQAYSSLTRTKRLEEPVLNQIATRYQKTPAQILLRWNLEQNTVPLPKANQLDHLQENLDLFDFQLTQDDVNSLNQLNHHYSSLGSLPYI